MFTCNLWTILIVSIEATTEKKRLSISKRLWHSEARNFSVRKSSQESASTQQIAIYFYGINLILSLLAPLYANEA